MEQMLLIMHISTGLIGILTGFVALATNKGSVVHVINGRLFCAAMLITGGAIIGLGISGGSISDTLGGLSIMYFIATAWLTLQFPNRSVNSIDLSLFICVASIVFANTYLGFHANELSLEYPPAQYCVVAFIHFIAGADDLFLLMKRRAGPKHRLIRHSWRMCLVLFMASGSFFLGQMKVFPKVLVENGMLLFFIPPLLSLFFMGYWLFRLSLMKREREIHSPH